MERPRLRWEKLCRKIPPLTVSFFTEYLNTGRSSSFRNSFTTLYSSNFWKTDNSERWCLGRGKITDWRMTARAYRFEKGKIYPECSHWSTTIKVAIWLVDEKTLVDVGHFLRKGQSVVFGQRVCAKKKSVNPKRSVIHAYCCFFPINFERARFSQKTERGAKSEIEKLIWLHLTLPL